MIYSMADLAFELESAYNGVRENCREYEIDETPLKKFEINSDIIESERNKSELNLSDDYFEMLAFCRSIAEWLPLNDAFLLHSSLIDIDGDGVIFAARSGVGKTTHTLLWRKLLGGKMKIVNGDKPFVRFIGDTPFGYSTPWRGKENLGCKMRTAIKHICFLERANENDCQELQISDAADLLLAQIYMPKNTQSAVETLGLADRFLKSCKLWKIRCNMDISAAETAYRTIFKNREITDEVKI